MPRSSNRWALVLAAGSGTRLSSLTADATGASVPKQFCSLNGGASLLEEALARAAAVASPAQTLVVVAAEHRRFWQDALADVPPHNVIVQPRNRGTANGILLGVSAILERDAERARRHRAVRSLRRARGRARARARACAMAAIGSDRSASIGFLGLSPRARTPSSATSCAARRSATAAAPSRASSRSRRAADAAKLVKRRALWNSFILVARAAALVELIALRHPVEVIAFHSLWQQMAWSERLPRELERLYEKLPEIDFSRGVVEGTTAPLHVVPVPACGWSDLGTPQRVAECLARLERVRDQRTLAARGSRARHFNLAEAYARLVGATPTMQTA